MQREHDLLNDGDEDCPPRTHEKDFTCDECGRTFPKPILATISSSDRNQTFYVCPRCMTKVQNFRAPMKEKARAAKEEKGPSPTVESKEPSEELQDVKCRNFFGYLKKHQKNIPFPDECLTCPRMVECLRH